LVERVLILVDVTIAEGLNGAGVLANDVDELINVLLGEVHGIFEHDPLHALRAGRCGE
jgi:hypothetical protein